MLSDDSTYYAMRAEQERKRAETTDRAEVRRLHLELASLYTMRAHEIEPQPQLRVMA